MLAGNSKTELPPSKRNYADTIKSYLLDHYREPIEIDKLAKLIHRSPNYATALFKEVYGHSPIRYMHQLRVLEACGLLLHSDMTIAHIAHYLGYYDTSYFYRMFKNTPVCHPPTMCSRAIGPMYPSCSPNVYPQLFIGWTAFAPQTE